MKKLLMIFLMLSGCVSAPVKKERPEITWKILEEKEVNYACVDSENLEKIKRYFSE